MGHCTPYKLSICTIFQNDARFLKEWIEYHKLLGVEHFWLYNNNSTDNFRKVLKPYIASGEVELFNWPNLPHERFEYGCQPRAYNNCIERAKGKTKWLAMIDTDEFLLPLEKNNILDVLKNCPAAGIICFWRCFGDSGVYKINGLMIEELTACSINKHPMNKWGKIIFRPETVLYYDNPHYPTFAQGYNAMDGSELIRINHYWSRDHKFFLERKLKREENSFGVDQASCYQRLADYNVDKNSDILRFVPDLKKRMKDDKHY